MFLYTTRMKIKIAVSIILLSALCSLDAENVVEYHIEHKPVKKPCSYFENKRFISAVDGMVNCSWYASNACCLRTEVTSVFSNMFPLYGATRDCTNHMNYMMCYFCDPNQFIWYHDKKVHICSDFCEDVYGHCMSAIYNGTRIGEAYRNGSSFCEAQNFNIVEGKDNCFNFDPLVFGKASTFHMEALEFVYATFLFYHILVLANLL